MNKDLFIHTGEKPFLCDAYGEQFTSAGELRTHILSHTGEKPFVCYICGEQFTSARELRTHIRIHIGTLTISL